MPPTITTDDLLGKVLEGLVALPAMKDQGDRIEKHLEELNGTVRENRTDIAVLKDWRDSQAGPATKQVADIRVEVAKVAAQVTGVGAVAVVVALVLRSLGVF